MQSHIDIDLATADKLRALAEARGVTVEDLLKELVADVQAGASNTSMPARDEFEADMEAFAEGTENLKSSYTGSYSREDIYFDRH